MPAKYNDSVITVQSLLFLLIHLNPETELFINKTFELAWLPTDDQPGGVVDFGFMGGALIPSEGDLLVPIELAQENAQRLLKLVS